MAGMGSVPAPVPDGTAAAAETAAVPEAAPVAPPATAGELAIEVLRAAMTELLRGRNLNEITLGKCRAELAGHFSLPVPPGLNDRKDEVDALTRTVVEELTAGAGDGGAEDFGVEDEAKSKSVYNITLPHPQKEFSADGIPPLVSWEYPKWELSGN